MCAEHDFSDELTSGVLQALINSVTLIAPPPGGRECVAFFFTSFQFWQLVWDFEGKLRWAVLKLLEEAVCFDVLPGLLDSATKLTTERFLLLTVTCALTDHGIYFSTIKPGIP